jgi:transposase
LGQLQLQHLYRGLDFLTENKERLEASLLQVLSRRLLADLNLVLFDTTSVYFEGEGPGELAKHGYSRDRRPDRPQVVLGLLTTADGLPLSHVVLPGNTADPKSLRQAMLLAARHLPISRMILVMDRGMVSEEGLKQLEAMGVEYIAGLRYRQLVTRDALRRGGRYRKVADNLQVKEVSGGPRRLVICYNPKEATRDRLAREEMVRYLEEQLDAKGVKGLLKTSVAKRYLTVQGQSASINHKRIAQDQANDGKWVLVTNTSLPAEEVALAYKGLWQVERAFRTLKTPLEIRPVYHWADRRVLGHIAACVLAYLLEKTLERKLAAAGLDLSPATALTKLRRLRAATVQLASKELVLPTEADEEQEAILRACGAQLPTRLQTA